MQSVKGSPLYELISFALLYNPCVLCMSEGGAGLGFRTLYLFNTFILQSKINLRVLRGTIHIKTLSNFGDFLAKAAS